MKDFRRLKVWEKVHLLTLDIYKATAGFPREEQYIAEGCGKQGNNELHRFLCIASGSASELDYHLLLARDLNYLSDKDYCRMYRDLGEARRMLTALVQKVNADRLSANC